MPVRVRPPRTNLIGEGENMDDELIRLSACDAVAKLRAGELSPLELIDAAAARIAAVEPEINALPTLCLARARAHAERLMSPEGREAESEPGWLAGLPVAIKDLADVAGVRHHLRFADFRRSRTGHLPSPGRPHRAQRGHRHRQIEHT